MKPYNKNVSAASIALNSCLLLSFIVTILAPLTGIPIHKLASTLFLLLSVIHTILWRKKDVDAAPDRTILRQRNPSPDMGAVFADCSAARRHLHCIGIFPCHTYFCIP